MEKGEKVAALAVGINLLLFGIKYTFSTLSGSIALKADAFHSLSDVVASSTVFVGLIIAKRKTKSFPYGLYKVENLVSVMVALAIFYAGYEIVMEATKGIAVELQNIWITIASVLCIIVITYGYSRYATKVGTEINSPSLIADAKHIGVDMFSSAMVLVVLLSSFAGVNLDKISAFIIVVIIAWSGGKILIDGIRVLLDASLDYNTLSLAEKLILAEPQVMEIQHLMGRNSGRYKFIEANIFLKTHELDRAHFIANRIEANIKSQIKNVDRVLIHYEPTKKENFIYAVPLEYANQQRISRHFGEAPYFGLITVRIKDKKAIEQKVIANPFTQADHGKGILAAEFLNKHLVDVVITKESFEGKGPYYVFSNAAVDNLLTEEETVEKALESIGIFF
ncbi:MAG: cation diffusion facilitator family transporter [Thermodesulfobacteriota bacterium]|nr:cation diffusion facilitator family transporter [Thermodesulfobacteriota bacterium]